MSTSYSTATVLPARVGMLAIQRARCNRLHTKINAEPSEIIYENRVTTRTSHPEKIFPAALTKAKKGEFADLPKGVLPFKKEAQEITVSDSWAGPEPLSAILIMVNTETDSKHVNTNGELLQLSLISEGVMRIQFALPRHLSLVASGSSTRMSAMELMMFSKDMIHMGESLREVAADLLNR